MGFGPTFHVGCGLKMNCNSTKIDGGDNEEDTEHSSLLFVCFYYKKFAFLFILDSSKSSRLKLSEQKNCKALFLRDFPRAQDLFQKHQCDR